MPKRSRARLRKLVRNFNENGMKFLLEHKGNVRELLQIVAGRWAKEIDFDKLQWVKTTFIRRDFRHAESDVLLTAPWRTGRHTRALLIYVLIEHQSKPDHLMPLRLVDYIVQTFNYQIRQWSQTHSSLAKARLSPVLPIVLYTGARRWPSIGTLANLIRQGEEFRRVTPILEEPLYLNLADADAEALKKGEHFGSVLQLIKQRRAKAADFRGLLEEVIRRLETMRPAERHRWLDTLSYIHALIYHEREPRESRRLQETLESSVAAEKDRQEIAKMGKTYAEVLMERGEKRGIEIGIKKGIEQGELYLKREMLRKLLELRFKRVPAKVQKTIERTNDIERLETWLERFATAESLEEVGIG